MSSPISEPKVLKQICHLKKTKKLFLAHKTILFSIILLLKRNSCRTNKHILFAFHKIKYTVFKKIYNCQFNINRG